MPIQFCHEEKEARQKWCPMSRAVNDTERPAANRFEFGCGSWLDNQTRCLGAGCMMWRWVATHVNDGKGGDMVLSENTHGYCGLSGPR